MGNMPAWPWPKEVRFPPFTRGKKQLEKVDVNWSREYSVVQIHINRVNGVLIREHQRLIR